MFVCTPTTTSYQGPILCVHSSVVSVQKYIHTHIHYMCVIELANWTVITISFIVYQRLSKPSIIMATLLYIYTAPPIWIALLLYGMFLFSSFFPVCAIYNKCSTSNTFAWHFITTSFWCFCHWTSTRTAHYYLYCKYGAYFTGFVCLTYYLK